MKIIEMRNVKIADKLITCVGACVYVFVCDKN